MRSLRGLQRVRGWHRVASMVAPERLRGAFVVANRVNGKQTYFAGDVSSFIDRQVYLFGNYESDPIAAFLSLIPANRRRVILDIGANVGTHSLAFAHAFTKIHAFEPNRSLWASFERNVSINGFANVTLHKLGLADRNGELKLYLIAKNNFGLGTFSTIEQYDLPLEEAGSSTVVIGDEYLLSRNITDIDAIKLDVQGFEQEVLRGLAKTLANERPFVWFEIGPGTQAKIGNVDDILHFCPYEHDLFRVESHSNSLLNSVTLIRMPTGRLPDGDYIVSPRE
jgi:FkbM family methyltransferase